MSKQILSGAEVLPRLLKGVNLIADCVKVSLGPLGRNCVYERLGTNQPISSRDGVTIAGQIESSDPFENIAIETIKGVAREAVDQSGDGTTSATLLAQAIFSEGVKATIIGSDPVALKRGIEKATRAVVEQLKLYARPVSGDMVKQVATISANNDEFIGSLISTAMDKAGDDGVVTVEASRSPESTLEIVEGMQFGTGWLAPIFVNNGERQECVLDDVAVFLHEKKLTAIKPMLPLIQALAQEGKSILVIAEEVTDEALAILAVNVERGLLKACAVKTPGGPDHLHDIAALTKARAITEVSGIKLSQVTSDHLGHAKRVVVKPTMTTIYGDSGENLGLSKRLTELRTQVKNASDEGVRLRLQARLARLAGGIAVIRVGGKTELEQLVRKDAIEDSMHATRGAKSEGVLPGGGIALIRASEVLSKGYDDEATGVEIVRKACFAPIRTLAENGGESAEFIIRQIKSGSDNYGWNARTGEFGDMVEFGVLDPLRVVRTALESAASIASTLLITSSLVANERPK